MYAQFSCVYQWQIIEFTVFLTKNRPVRQQNVPYLGQLSDQSTRKKYLGLQKAPGAAKRL